jgi:type II secretory pathway pseudopilin PulG
VTDSCAIAGRHPPGQRASGVVLLALLLTLALGSIALMAAVDVWALARQRAQEVELLFVGDQYRQAIQRYYFGAPPGTRRVLPARLEDLLEDDRYPMPVRHLRRLYPDPVTGSNEWGTLRVGERISGVYSLSEKETIKQAGFAPGYEKFEGKTVYRDWIFAVNAVAAPAAVTPPSAGRAASGPAPSLPPQRPVRRTPS